MRQRQLFLLCMLCPAAASSQTRSVMPESHTVMAVPNARILKLGTLRGSSFVVSGSDTTLDGTFEEQLLTHGDSIIRIRRGQSTTFGASLDTIIDRVPDLHPFIYSNHSERTGTNYVIFHGNQYQESGATPTGRPSSHSGVFLEGAWDMPSNTLVVEASQLQSGVTLAFTVVYPGADSVYTVEAIVGDVEQVRGQPCWKVTLVFGHQVIATEWINEQTRRIERQVAPMDQTHTLVMEAKELTN